MVLPAVLPVCDIYALVTSSSLGRVLGQLLKANGRDQIHAVSPNLRSLWQLLVRAWRVLLPVVVVNASTPFGAGRRFSLYKIVAENMMQSNGCGERRGRIVALAEGQRLQTGKLSQEREAGGATKVNGFIAVIESRILMQECIRRSMQSAFSLPILPCSTLSELELGLKGASAAIVIVSWMEGGNEVNTNVLNALSELVPNVPVVVLAQTNDVDLARIAIRHGAKGYIPCTLGFEIAVGVARFVLAGGT